jgi:hypothetical protein
MVGANDDRISLTQPVMLQGDAPVQALDVLFDEPRAMRLQAVPDDQQFLADRPKLINRPRVVNNS